MRPKTLPILSSVLAIGFAVNFLIVPSLKAQTPPGSYQQSCKDINVVDGNLVALCKTNDGQWRLSTLASPQNCHGDIAVSDGKLQCLNVKNTLLAAPAGSYQKTCKDAAVADGVLLAQCQMTSGEWRGTTLADALNCKGDIGNNNGKLECRAKTTEFAAGWVKTGSLCTVEGKGSEFLLLRLGGRTDSPVKIVFDKTYTDGVISIYMPKGSTRTAGCGAFDYTGKFTYMNVQ